MATVDLIKNSRLGCTWPSMSLVLRRKNCYNLQDPKPEKPKRHLRVSERIPDAHRSPVPLTDEGWNLKMESGFKHRKRALLNYKYQDQKQEHSDERR